MERKVVDRLRQCNVYEDSLDLIGYRYSRAWFPQLATPLDLIFTLIHQYVLMVSNGIGVGKYIQTSRKIECQTKIRIPQKYIAV